MNLWHPCDEDQNGISDSWSGVKQDFSLIWQQVSVILKGLPLPPTDNGFKYPNEPCGLYDLNQKKKVAFLKLKKK